MALAADCLALAERWGDDDAVLAVVQALAGIAETTRDRPPLPVPAADRNPDSGSSVEDERVEDAMAATVAMI